MPEVKMPQLGESVVEGTVTKWLKSEGDSVDEDELLVEISTDKVDSEVPSTASGVLQKILVQEGDTAKVGDAIAVVGEDGQEAGGGDTESSDDEGGGSEAPEAQEQERAEDTQGDEAGGEQGAGEEAPEGEAPEGEGSQDAEAAAEDNQPEAPEGSSDEAAPQEQPSAETQEADGEGTEDTPQPSGDGAADTSKRRIISPLVRRLADEHGVDLESVEGTGTGGRIRKQDVLQAAEGGGGGGQAEPAAREKAPPAQAQDAEPPAQGQDAGSAQPEGGAAREELVPWTNIRRRTAEHMVASHLETARAWNAVEVDWTRAVEAREKAKAAFREREGFNLTYMPFLARALCETLLEMPEVNAAFDEANQANLVRRYVNLGIAVALEGGGLIVPVVKGADEKNLVGLARSISDVAQRARTKKVTPDDLTGGTFTITNPGPFGSIVSVPIIPRGQAAILGFEAITKRVVVTEDDAIAIRSIGFLTMSWDHRIIDGAEAARFLARLRERLQSTDFSGDLAQYL
ncbi:MAG: 2-oxo acid dehydrogenase subunit E2 [Actinomycetota bacterium]|nr:2-oxo acid dehydrogenase subunit E2 [Actinomycetota bacterium]